MAVDLGFDESGSDKIILVSMQVATVQKAKKVHTAWKAELQEAHLDFFHSIDFAKIEGGIFRHLNKKQREALLAKLSQLIRGRYEIGLSVWIDIERYNDRTNQGFRSRWGTAYTHAIHMLVLLAYLYSKHRGLGFDVNILIEGGHRNSDQAFQILRDLQKINGTAKALLNILTVAPGSKNDHPILQAADMLAYSEWQKLSDGKMEIYDALHIDGSRYEPEVIGHNDTLIDNVLDGTVEWKMWGKRKPKEG
jgi:hypothetical protein